MKTDIDQSARVESQKQWNTNPCGALEGNETTLAYYQDVEADRYRQQYWQLEYFDFDKFKGKKILEIGIGHGTDLAQFAKNGADCHGIDITDKHFELTRTNFELRGFKLTLKHSDATQIDFPDNYFDGVYSFGVLHHIPEMDECLSEIHRVLKPNGKFQVALYHKWSTAHMGLLLRGILTGKLFRLGYRNLLSTVEEGADGSHIKPYVKLYTKSSLKKMLKDAGFESINLSVNQINHPGNNLLNSLKFVDNLFGWYVSAKSSARKS